MSLTEELKILKEFGFTPTICYSPLTFKLKCKKGVLYVEYDIHSGNRRSWGVTKNALRIDKKEFDEYHELKKLLD